MDGVSGLRKNVINNSVNTVLEKYNTVIMSL